jgi:hypothetical protein
MLSSSVSSLARHATRRTALPTIGAVRNLNVHEYISMEIMKEHGIAIPEGYVASTPEEAENQYLKGLQHSKFFNLILFNFIIIAARPSRMRN